MLELQEQSTERPEKIKRLVRTLSVFKPSTATAIQYYNFLRELCIINNCSVEEGIERAGITWKDLSPEQRRFYNSKPHAVLPIPVPLNLVYNALRDERCGRLSLAKRGMDGRQPKYVVESYSTELHIRHRTRKEAERRYLDFFDMNSKSNKAYGIGAGQRAASGAVAQRDGGKIESSLGNRHGRRHHLSIWLNKHQSHNKKIRTIRSAKCRKKQNPKQTFLTPISTVAVGMPKQFLLDGTERTAMISNALGTSSASATKKHIRYSRRRSHSITFEKSKKSKNSYSSNKFRSDGGGGGVCRGVKAKQLKSNQLSTLNSKIGSLGTGVSFRNVQRNYGSGDADSRKNDKCRKLAYAGANTVNETLLASIGVNGVVKSATNTRSNASGKQKLKKRKRSKRKASHTF